MAHIITSAMLGSGNPRRLSTAQKRAANRQLAKAQADNPLRRVRLECHGWVRDSVAVVGDWLWCTPCEQLRRAVELKE